MAAMKSSLLTSFIMVISTSFLILVTTTTLSSADAFSPSNAIRKHISSNIDKKSNTQLQSSTNAKNTAAGQVVVVEQVSTKPIAGMKPGTSGLRKKVEVWQHEEHYLQNFVQSLLDTAIAKRNGKLPDTIIVAGDGRYYNDQAIPIICQMLAANGIANIWVPVAGIMSTPAVSAAIRAHEQVHGGIILTASHNPGGPGQDFGIKYNLELGQPAGEDFTDELYERSLKIESYKTLSGGDSNIIDINAPVGTTFALTPTSTVTIMDPFQDYVACLQQCFDFEQLSQFVKNPAF